MKKILVLGAGLSSSYLIKYLLQNASKEKWEVIVADTQLSLAQDKIGKSKFGSAITLDVTQEKERKNWIEKADLVVSLLPPNLHLLVAKDCLHYKKNLVTASYLSNEMKDMHAQVLKANVLFLNEIGLDPGIDHLSAMQMIQKIQAEGGVIDIFESFCGGLVAPEFDDNPWHYKFTWNPRNVVLAGQATARYLQDGLLKFIPPNRIFTQTKKVKVSGAGSFEAYANRDSLSYIEPYGIGSAHTVLRGTLRKKGFSEAWDCLVELGLTDDTYTLPHSENLSYRELVAAFLNVSNIADTEEALAQFLCIKKSSKLFKKLLWLSLLEPNKINIAVATPAQALQKLLQEKWQLQKHELDQIIMQHQISYTQNNKTYKIQSDLVVTGENQKLTAMAKTVGLPMAIACKLILQQKIKSKGVQIPLSKEFYEPILAELQTFGITFEERFVE
jgi:saccharopine dehydrogenase-like NADP-dependent oxidoreductase